ncbi:uncharacterized protein LOC141901712 [Tubulanus polymorphus]|uniref:uncharacterized protein LOC141901712 n=1 Tax=Tubulanus polymorphus TaxID=672921 RepID=UPI003DA2D4F5
MAARHEMKRTHKSAATRGDRLNVIARFWSKPTPHRIHIVDKGPKSGVVIVAESKDIAAWWISTFKTAYPQDKGAESGSIVKLRPEPGVSLKVNSKDGSLCIGGRNHWVWFTENFETILDSGLYIDAVDGHTGQFRYSELMEVLDKELDMGDDMEMVMLIKDLPRAGAVRNGPKYIYIFWKALLHRWMTQSAEITIATPKLDARRLAEIYLLAIRNHLASFRARLVTQKICDGRLHFKRVQKDAIAIMQKVRGLSGKKGFVTNEKIKWALNAVRVAFMTFNCNFISGAVSDERNEILVTSAAFHADNFAVNKRDSVCFSRMTRRGLSEFYLQPLGVEPITAQTGRLPRTNEPPINYDTIKASYASNASLASFDPDAMASHQISFDTEWSGSTATRDDADLADCETIDRKLEAKKLAADLELDEVNKFSAELDAKLVKKRTHSFSSFKLAQSMGSLDSI